MKSFRDALEAAEPRPPADGEQEDKKNYAERLSRCLATAVANLLRPGFPGVSPAEDGTRQEAPARTSKGVKKLDVNYSTPELGLGLGVSIKTLNYRDRSSNRYTKNYTRIDNELRAEAQDYHLRQPYAVLVAIVFLPVDACEDGSARTPSSFGAAVRTFRHRAGRATPKDEEELFERVFVALYEHEGPRRGEVAVFDVMDAPPRRGRPRRPPALTFRELIQEIRSTYDQRNNPPFAWAEDEAPD